MKKICELGFTKSVALLVIAAMVLSFMSLSAIFSNVGAASLESASDVLSDSDLSAAANHTITFTTNITIPVSGKIVLDFHDSFNGIDDDPMDFNDLDVASSTGDLLLAATPGSGDSAAAGVATSSNEIITIILNDTNAITADTITIEIGTHAASGASGVEQISNPGSEGEYDVVITTQNAASAELETVTVQMYVIDDVVVTATVDTSLTFDIDSVATSQSVNGATTNIESTETTIPFGTLTAGTPKIGAQDLQVTTNAADGFTVTMFQDDNLTSNSGSDINGFQTDVDTWVANTAPAVWVDPNGYDVLDDVSTYGHFGYTTQDDSLGTGTADRFTDTGDEWASFTTEDDGTSTNLEIFHHDGPADGTTAHKGQTRVGFQVEITALQEAGDYTNVITYVATPVY